MTIRRRPSTRPCGWLHGNPTKCSRCGQAVGEEHYGSGESSAIGAGRNWPVGGMTPVFAGATTDLANTAMPIPLHVHTCGCCRSASPSGAMDSAPAVRHKRHRDMGPDETHMGIFSEIFSWWGGNTWRTASIPRVRASWSARTTFGNRYYVQRKGVGPLGVPRRWVIYRNLAEASQVPPEWHGWLHYTVDTPPTEEEYTPAALAEAASHEHDRHAARPIGPPVASWPAAQAAQGDGRLQALAAGIAIGLLETTLCD